MKLETLIKKREALEKQIADAQRMEKRKSEIACLLEKTGILDLPDEVLLAEFQKMGIPLTHVKFYWTVFAKTHHAAPPQDLNASPAKWLFAALEARPVFRITGATCVKGIPIFQKIGKQHLS
ncbi:MAG: hypothetical protein CO125_04655 [Hydrogenophilales bacterium CG_4_9_14_3_um_filter_59_35]|nr:MAG: hypothetical protein CO125_04655 [Hydrogenophilales bacterium CG_4_9_14_3_um_filter_59_35]